MKYCNKCLKQVPTKIIENKEECMVCGHIIGEPVETRTINKVFNETREKIIVDKNKSKYIITSVYTNQFKTIIGYKSERSSNYIVIYKYENNKENVVAIIPNSGFLVEIESI